MRTALTDVRACAKSPPATAGGAEIGGVRLIGYVGYGSARTHSLTVVFLPERSEPHPLTQVVLTDEAW
ncbi:MAG TPA: hypothetical protein PLK77_11705 [Pyrinomonadaceae bacterium]|nr:hypothetical protein [Pyrinomonadaceae bacterium]